MPGPRMRLPAKMNLPGWHWVAHASAPSIWGHLPGQAGAVALETLVGEARAWQHWWIDQTQTRQTSRGLHRERGPTRTAKQQWFHLEPQTRPRERAWEPVAFILPPGTLSMATEHFVMGSVICWEDPRSLPQPLIIYQLSNRRWLEQHLQPFGSPASNPVQAWLYALCALLGCYQPQAEPPRSPLPQAIRHLWRLFAPGWAQWLGQPQLPPSLAAMQMALGDCTGLGDAAPELQRPVLSAGLPWDDWPRCLWSKAPRGVFWQHDLQGTCLATGTGLNDLWPY